MYWYILDSEIGPVISNISFKENLKRKADKKQRMAEEKKKKKDKLKQNLIKTSALNKVNIKWDLIKDSERLETLNKTCPRKLPFADTLVCFFFSFVSRICKGKMMQ